MTTPNEPSTLELLLAYAEEEALTDMDAAAATADMPDVSSGYCGSAKRWRGVVRSVRNSMSARTAGSDGLKSGSVMARLRAEKARRKRS